MDAADTRRERLATTMNAEADLARSTARGLEDLAGEVTGRLDPVVAALRPGTWAGRSGDAAREAAGSAAEDLARAAQVLFAIAAELRVEALTADGRAAQLRRPRLWRPTDGSDAAR